MTEEAIKQAEEELKSQSPTKVKRAKIGFNKTKSKPAESRKGKENEPTDENKPSPTKDDVAVCSIGMVRCEVKSQFQEKIKSRAELFGGKVTLNSVGRGEKMKPFKMEGESESDPDIMIEDVGPISDNDMLSSVIIFQEV